MAQVGSNVDALLKARAEIDEQLRRHKNALTVLFTDVVGSTSFFERFGDTAGLAMVHRHAELAASIVQQHDGSVIKTIGDSVMAEFPGPGSAVHAAVEIEQQLLELNLTLPQHKRVELRIGIHTGVGFRKGNDVFGDVVNVAARITKRTAAAQILISRAVREAISEESDLSCQWLSKLTIDGRTEKEDIFEVIWTDAATYRDLRQRLAGPANFPSRYEVLSQVGTGGTGMVYKARDLETGEIVAVKILKPEIASDPEVQENFKKELRLARKITHKNVGRIHEFSRCNGTAFTTMEFIEGETLLSMLHRVGSLPPSQALDIARQICAGLREAHAQGIVHRDLKPANIMVDRNGNVKIMDFGVARLVQGNGPLTGTIVGTPAYMAPEQAELKPVDARTDIYAVGLLLYEMVTGTPAFGGDTPVAVALKQIREFPKRPRELMPTLPGYLESVILKCLEKHPANRFQSVDELERALEKTAKARPAPPWKISVAPQLRRAALELHRTLHSYMGRVSTLLQKQDWRGLRRIPTKRGPALAAALFSGGLLVAFLGHGWKSSTSSSLRAEVPAPTVIQSAPESIREAEKKSSNDADKLVAPNSASASDMTSTPVSGHDVTIQVPNLVVDSDHVPDSAASPIVKSPARPVPKHVSGPARTKELKAQSSERVSKPVEAQAPSNPAELKTPPAEPVAPPAATPAATQATVSPPGPKIIEQAPATKPAVPAVPADDVNATQAGPASSSTFYLDVGTFKDEAWANSAVEKLNQLGYHAVCVHKGLLWVQSYHVQVGPYTDRKEMEAARSRLATQGFKTRAVK